MNFSCLFFISLLFLFSNQSISQNRYRDFLKPADDQHCTMFMVSAQFMYTPVGKAVKGVNGFYGNFGLNIARFFSRKIIVGVVLDWRIAKGLFAPNFSNGFCNDFNENFISSFSDPADSVRAYGLKDALNDQNHFWFVGNYFINYGVAISPFPDQYGGLLLQIKQGSYAYPVIGAYNNPYLKNGTSDYIDLVVPKKWIVELSCKPKSIFKKPEVELKKFNWLHFIQVSIFYEQLSFTNAAIDGLHLTEFLQPSFFDAYGIDHHFGVKLGYGIY